jgi:hypothetical protein
VETATRAPGTATKARYIPRGRNQLHTIFEPHLDEFCDDYDERYAAMYGMFRLERIRQIGDRFLTCGDYRLGVARIRCSNPACGHGNFRPFSCKGFYLCPSCSQKRTLLFSEHLTNEVLLDLPHRQFVFTAEGASTVLPARPMAVLFDALDFLAQLTQQIPSRRVQLIRRYGLYSSRNKGRWSQMPHVAARAPEGWRESHLSEASAVEDPGFEPLDDGEEVTVNARKRAWARLLAKVYEIDPLVCPKCGSEMKCSFATAKPLAALAVATGDLQPETILRFGRHHSMLTLMVPKVVHENVSAGVQWQAAWIEPSGLFSATVGWRWFEVTGGLHYAYGDAPSEFGGYLTAGQPTFRNPYGRLGASLTLRIGGGRF